MNRKEAIIYCIERFVKNDINIPSGTSASYLFRAQGETLKKETADNLLARYGFVKIHDEEWSAPDNEQTKFEILLYKKTEIKFKVITISANTYKEATAIADVLEAKQYNFTQNVTGKSKQELVAMILQIISQC